MKRYTTAVLLLLVSIVTGVDAGSPQASAPVRGIPVIDAKGFQHFISRHKGEVLVVNFWATWCVPCVEEIPDLIRLHNELKDRRVRVVGISIDDPEDSTSKVAPFLSTRKIPYQVLIKASGADEAFINAVKKDWSGAVPATFIYDRTGVQRKMLIGKQTLAGLRKAVEEVTRHAPR